jgi:hypothetical protein
MAIVTLPGAAISAASDLVDNIQLNREIYHLYFGKIDSWTSPSDIPDVYTSTLVTEREVRNNMAYFRRVMPGEVSLCAIRNEWAIAPNNKVYTQWDDTMPNSVTDYHVVNSNFEVYKCLDNNNGALSTIEPVGRFYTPIKLLDGYIWKYLFTIPVAKRKRFNSFDRMPVQVALSDTFYSQGAIGRVSILANGTGYPNLQITNLNVSGASSGSGLVATVTAISGSGGITAISVTNGGSGYTSALFTIAGVGTGAVIEPILSSGVITGFTIVTPGFNYSVTNAITSSVGGAILLPVIDPITGTILSVKIVDSGSGYTAAPTISISILPGYAAGIGKYVGNGSALIVANMLNGRIDTVSINDPGLNYLADSATSITVIGDGSGAELVPVITASGAIAEIFIKSGGVGYTYANAIVSGVGGSGAIVSIILNDSDIISDQSIVEQSALDGGIHLIVVSDAGAAYTTFATVTITGDGTGCTASAIVQQGAIIKINIDNPGSGYTWAEATITDSGRSDPGNILPLAIARVVISPAGGHGRNAVNELRVDSVCISSILQDIPEFTLIAQDFRQYGLIKNVRQFNTNRKLTAVSSYEAIITTFDSTVGLAADMVIENNTASFKVIYISGTTVHLLPLGRKPISPIGILRTLDGVTSWACSGILTYPTTDRYTGNLLFVSNEVPFTLDEIQGINIKTYLRY